MRQERNPRILLVAATTGYQTRVFSDAVRRHGAELVFATDRCHQLDDPWYDDAIAIRFNDEPGSVRAIVDATVDRPIHGVVAVGDRPAVIGALAADAIGVPGHRPEAVRIASNKLMTRQCLAKAGLPGPWFKLVAPDVSVKEVTHQVTYPCVIKPLALAASRGVMRANTPMELESACERLRMLLQDPDIRALCDSANEAVLIEEYVPEVKRRDQNFQGKGGPRHMPRLEKRKKEGKKEEKMENFSEKRQKISKKENFAHA